MKALKEKLVGFDGYTIYKIYIEEQNKVIRAKHIRIFKDIIAKIYSFLSNFDKKLTFNRVQLSDSKNDLSMFESMTFEDEIKIKKSAYKAILLIK